MPRSGCASRAATAARWWPCCRRSWSTRTGSTSSACPATASISRRKIEKAFTDEVVDIAFADGSVTATTRGGRVARSSPRTTSCCDHCQTCRYPNPRYADDLAADLVPEPDDPKPDVAAASTSSRRCPPAEKDAKLERGLRDLHPLLRLHPRLPGLLLLGPVRVPVAQAGPGQPAGGAQREPHVPDGPHVPRGRALPVVRRLRPGLPGGDPALPAAPQDEQGALRHAGLRGRREPRGRSRCSRRSRSTTPSASTRKEDGDEVPGAGSTPGLPRAPRRSRARSWRR